MGIAWIEFIYLQLCLKTKGDWAPQRKWDEICKRISINIIDNNDLKKISSGLFMMSIYCSANCHYLYILLFHDLGCLRLINIAISIFSFYLSSLFLKCIFLAPPTWFYCRLPGARQKFRITVISKIDNVSKFISCAFNLPPSMG